MDARWGLGIGVVLSLVGCSEPRPYVVDEVSAPVHATLRVRFSRRDITVPYRPVMFLEVAGASLYVECQNPYATRVPEGRTRGLLAVHPRGGYVAARCDAGDDWTIYVVSGADTFAYPRSPLFTGPNVAWGRLPPLETLVRAALLGNTLQLEAATRVVERAEGREGLGRFLRTLATGPLAPGTEDPNGPAQDAFVAALARVPEADRAAVSATLLELLLGGQGTPAQIERALRVVDLAAPSLDVGRLRSIVEGCEAFPAHRGCADALRRLTVVAPDQAAALVCTLVGDRSDYDIGALRLAVWAYAGTRCEPWARAHEARDCADLVGGRTCPSAAGPRDCTADDYRAEVAAELARGGIPEDTIDWTGHSVRMITAAGRAMGLACAGPALGPLGPRPTGGADSPPTGRQGAARP